MAPEIKIPPQARPHEVAVLLLYAMHRSCKVVAAILQYRGRRPDRPVQKVVRKYRRVLVQCGCVPQDA